MAASVCRFLLNFLPKRKLHIQNLQGKHVFITGGSTGLGLALAEKVIAGGGSVTITGRGEKKLLDAEAFLKSIRRNFRLANPDAILPPQTITIKVLDVCDFARMEAAINEVPIDVLVCNAGVTRGGFLDEISKEDADTIVSTNILGVIYTVKAALPMMKSRCNDNPSSIVIIGSLASMFCMYGHGVYTASKYAVKGYAECLRLELVPYKIRVSLICPGFIETPFLDEAEKDPNLKMIMSKISKYDRKRADTPQHVADLIVTAVKQGRFLVTNEPLGDILFVLSRGFMPPEGVVRTFLETVLFIPIRVISILAAFRIKRQILRQHQRSHQ